MFGGLVSVAETLTIIQKKNKSERTRKETKLLQYFNRLKTDGIREKEKMNLLLRLAIQDKRQRKIYKIRYIFNRRLLKDEEDLNALIKSKIAKHAINIQYENKKVKKTAKA